MIKIAKHDKPFDIDDIAKTPCFRCGKLSYSQWQICSDNRKFRPLCFSCDMELNKLVLDFMHFPDAEDLYEKYLILKILEYREDRGEFPAGYLSPEEEEELDKIFKERKDVNEA